MSWRPLRIHAGASVTASRICWSPDVLGAGKYDVGAGDVRVITAPDPKLQQPTDALVRVTRACVCGSDLHPYHSAPASAEGSSIGHELIGVVEEVGAEVTTVTPGDFVIAPFAISCGVCEFCRAGLQTSCVNGGGHWPGRAPRASGMSEGVPMALFLWIFAVMLFVSGLGLLIRGQVLWGIAIIVTALLVGPGGVSLFT